MGALRLNNQQLRAICNILGETNDGLTKKVLTELLVQTHIDVLSDGKQSNGLVFVVGLNKRDWLYKCLDSEVRKSKSWNRVFDFILKSLNPVAYTGGQKRDQYYFLLEEVNKVLLLAGYEVTKEGRLRQVTPAETLDEVDRRVNSLQRQLYQRSIHAEVRKYCIKDYLERDYYDAVFEAAKGLAERVRNITGLSTDGGELFQTAFSKSNPYLFFNGMQTKSEVSEFTGLKELLESIFHLVRNPIAHTPKINWKIDETTALDILTLISFAHKYLDECHKIPGK